MKRYFTFVGRQLPHHQIVHRWGVPPNFRQMPWPRVVLIEGDDGEGMTYRYAADGEFAGDTWHESIDDAFQSAQGEYEKVLGEWLEVPAEVVDANEFVVLKVMKESLNENSHS